MTLPSHSAPADAAAPVLALAGLRVHFHLGGKGLFGRRIGTVRAVDGVDLAVAPGETLALVGESGCGKTTLGRAVVGLAPVTGGSVRVGGQDLLAMDRPTRQATRRRVQMVFQDPYSSVNPRLTVGDAIAEPLLIHRLGAPADQRETARALIDAVGLPVDALNRYPHEFSGGQRQRIAIARALAPDPALIVADEPLSALDVSIQSQVLNLLKELQEQRGLSYLFISHDLAVVEHLADRVAVMYLGRIVETGAREDVFERPSHPYTQALIDAIPQVGRGKRRRGRTISGDVPSPLDPPSGCAFHPRCPKARDLCRAEAPTLAPAPGRPGQLAACHFKD